MQETTKAKGRDPVSRDTLSTVVAGLFVGLFPLLVAFLARDYGNPGTQLVVRPSLFTLSLAFYIFLLAAAAIMRGADAIPSISLYLLEFSLVGVLFLVVLATGGLQLSPFSAFYGTILAVASAVPARSGGNPDTGGRVSRVVFFTAWLVLAAFSGHLLLYDEHVSFVGPIDPSVGARIFGVVPKPAMCYAALMLYTVFVIALSLAASCAKDPAGRRRFAVIAMMVVATAALVGHSVLVPWMAWLLLVAFAGLGVLLLLLSMKRTQGGVM